MKNCFVVAPHHCQIRALQARLATTSLSDLSIGTVETVQGREAQLVLVLYALTSPEAVQLEADFLYSQPRLNVALTRAKRKAVLLTTRCVASPDVGVASGGEGVDAGLAFLRRARGFAKQRGGYVRLAAVPGGGFRVDESGEGSDDEEGQGARPLRQVGSLSQEEEGAVAGDVDRLTMGGE